MTIPLMASIPSDPNQHHSPLVSFCWQMVLPVEAKCHFCACNGDCHKGRHEPFSSSGTCVLDDPQSVNSKSFKLIDAMLKDTGTSMSSMILDVCHSNEVTDACVPSKLM